MRKIKPSVLKTFLFVFLCFCIATIVFASGYDTPSAPGRPNIVSLNKNGCKLEYLRPISDGGSPITGYYIEYMELSVNKWRALNSVPNKELTFEVIGASEGVRVMFRVIAENKIGRGKPSKPSDPITFGDPYRLQ